MLWLVLSGCKIYGGQTKGQGGALSFYEPNDYPADTPGMGIGFERPIALGARADAWVLAPGISSLTSASVDDPDIVSSFLLVYPIVLRGLAEGTTTLRVNSSKGSDSLALTVVRPDGAQLWEPRPGLPSLAVPDSFFGQGPAYREGASVSVAAEPLAGTRPLLGFDLFQWSIDPPLLSQGADGRTVNTVRLTALGQPGTAQITTQLGGDFEVTTLSTSEVPTLQAYRAPPDLSQPFAITALAPEDIANFLLGATDAAGHYVVPSLQDESQFQADITAGTVQLLEAKKSGHYITLRACAGSGTLRLRYLGAELSLPIEVTAQVADAACP